MREQQSIRSEKVTQLEGENNDLRNQLTEAYAVLNQIRRHYEAAGGADVADASGDRTVMRVGSIYEKDDLTADLIRAKLTLAEI